MSSTDSSEFATPKCKIIANQAAELVTLQQKLNRLEGIGKRYEAQNKLLDDALKGKHALQEIFFNTSQQKRELESTNKHLQDLIHDKDYILKECKEDNSLEVESIKRVRDLQVASLKKQNKVLQGKHDCYTDMMDTQHQFKSGFSAVIYDTLCAKYKLIKTDNTILKKELKLFKTQFHLMDNANTTLRKYEPIVLTLLEQIQHFEAEIHHFEAELRTKQQILDQVMTDDEVIRRMYDELKEICTTQDRKIIQITAKNNKLNTIIEQNDIHNAKMQKHFQKDIASKERTIVKLETKLETLVSRSNTHQDANESLTEEHEVLKERITSLRTEKGLLKQEIQHISDKLKNKDDYMEPLKKQIEDNNQQIGALQNRENQSDAKYKKLNDKYRLNLSKLKKLADKLAQQLEAKKRFKKQYLESKQQLTNVFKENERIEKETDKQCDAVQHTMEQYKQKILKKNKQIHGFEETLNQIETENRQYQQQIMLLQKDNENQKLLIQHLEIDNNEQSKYVSKAREVSHKNRNVLTQIMNENEYSQVECSEILHDIEEEETPQTDEDDDLAMDEIGLAGNKRRRSEMMEEEEQVEEIEYEEPPKKKARRSENNAKKKKKRKTKKIVIDGTPFKGNKQMFEGR
eukprot:357940_1